MAPSDSTHPSSLAQQLQPAGFDCFADLAAWRSAYRQWQRATDELLPLAESRVDLERASFAAGRAELLDVIDAIKTLAVLRVDILQREEATVEAAANLRLTYGEYGR